MIASLLVLVVGLGLAGVAAAIGVAAAAVSQVELTRWVHYKLRGTEAAVRLLEHPGRVLATANALTTMGVVIAAAAVPALLAQTTPPFLGVFTVAVIIPLFVSAAYLVPRVLGRRWAEPIVARALPWMERAGDLLAPFIPRREPSTQTALAAVLSSVDTEALAGTDEIEVVSGVLAFSDRPVRELMTPRTAIVAIPEGLAAAEMAHVFSQSGYSRYPVYRGSLDEIVGTAGLVTFEDVLRALVAEVFEPPPPPAGTAPARIMEFVGNAPVTALAETFGTAPPARGAETVGGLLVQTLGRIPRPGERFILHGFEFDVLAATATHVERVAVRPGPVKAVGLDRPEDASASEIG